jgi:hypothetical protein
VVRGEEKGKRGRRRNEVKLERRDREERVVIMDDDEDLLVSGVKFSVVAKYRLLEPWFFPPARLQSDQSSVLLDKSAGSIICLSLIIITAGIVRLPIGWGYFHQRPCPGFTRGDWC